MIATIATSDVVRGYRRALHTSLRRASEAGLPEDLTDLLVTDASAMAGASLRDAGLPRRVLVTAIERDGQLITPNGDSVLSAGDRLLVLGDEDALRDLRTQL